MGISKAALLLIFLINLNFVCMETEEDHSGEEFIPTSEWQIVKKGQKVPPGLHIRMNLEEGYTEAKLLDPKDSVGSNYAVIKSEDPEKDTKQVKMDPLTLKRIKEKPRKVHDNRISALIDEHVKASKDKKIKNTEEILLAVLENLEDLVHHVDYAIDFIRQEGLELVIFPNLNSTSDALKSQSLLVLGSCMQNNEDVKRHAFEIGILQQIHRIFAHDSDINVKLRAIYALGSMLRLAPPIQAKFANTGGLATCLNILGMSHSRRHNVLELSHTRLKVKTVNLLNDLMLEREVMDILSKNYIYGDKENVYDVDIGKYLLEQNYCELLASLLKEVTAIDPKDFLSVEIVLFAMETVKGTCGKNYNENDRSNIKSIANFYNDMQVTDQSKDILISTQNSLNEIIKSFSGENETDEHIVQKQEL